jgi:hypothetical protein
MGQQGKKNKFVDRRIGEDDPNVSQEDKLLIRFQKTRQVCFLENEALRLLRPRIASHPTL